MRECQFSVWSHSGSGGGITRWGSRGREAVHCSLSEWRYSSHHYWQEPMSLLKAGRQTHGLLLLALETLTTSLMIFLQVLSIEIEPLTGHYIFSGGNALNRLCVSV